MNNTNTMSKRFQIMLSIVSLFFVVVFYLLLQPRVSNLTPFIRNVRLTTFIKDTVRNNSISAQEFWQLREFYSPGVIQFNNRNIVFTSNKITSFEALVATSISLQSLLPEHDKWRVVFQKKNELIATYGDETYIYFIKPISEMAQANGFFDYKDKDKKLLQGKNWYVETIIKK